MMRDSTWTLYWDAYSGAAGDMLLASLLDLGAPAELLSSLPDRLGIGGEVDIAIEEARSSGLRGTRVTVMAEEQGVERQAGELLELIRAAHLPARAEAWAVHAIERLAATEAHLHGTTPERVHLHEVGGQDAVIDVAGTCLLVDYLDPGNILVSPINVGSGRVKAAHGELPVPAPATLALLMGFPVYGTQAGHELTTPTGAALLTTLARPVGAFPAGVPSRIGMGLGHHELPWANALRAVRVEGTASREGVTRRPAMVLATNLDDMSPEWVADLTRRLFTAGARDVWVEPVQMKKGRPGVTLKVLTAPELAERLAGVVFAESTTLGLRAETVETWELARDVVLVETPYGAVGVKVAWMGSRIRSWAPEYEEARAAAEQAGVPLRTVMEAAWLAGHRWVEEQEAGRES
jgi:uncharacterized protein (TIGR00299 family) protein